MQVDDFVPKDTVTPSASTARELVQLNSGCVLPKKRRSSLISSSVYIGQHEVAFIGGVGGGGVVVIEKGMLRVLETFSLCAYLGNCFEEG